MMVRVVVRVVVQVVVEAVSGMPSGGDNQICRLFAIDIAVDCVCHRGPASPPSTIQSSGGPCPPSQHRAAHELSRLGCSFDVVDVSLVVVFVADVIITEAVPASVQRQKTGPQ